MTPTAHRRSTFVLFAFALLAAFQCRAAGQGPGSGPSIAETAERRRGMLALAQQAGDPQSKSGSDLSQAAPKLDGNTADSSKSNPTEKPTLRVPVGEIFRLGPSPHLQSVCNWVASRDIVVEPAHKHVVAGTRQFVGTRQGLVAISLVGQVGKNAVVDTYLVEIVPSGASLTALVRQQYPNANVRVAAAADGAYVLEGTVDSPAESEQVIDLIKQYLGPQDRLTSALQVGGVMQVQLEVCIARVERAALRQFGVNFITAGKDGFFGQRTGEVAGLPTLNARGGFGENELRGGAVVADFVGRSVANAAAPGVLTSNANLFFGVTPASGSVYAFIEALSRHNLAKILANPTLVTLSGRQADFLVGGEQPFPASTALGATATEFKPFGTRLNFLPVVLGGGKIRLDVRPEVSRLTTDESSTINNIRVPRLETQRFQTTVEITTGQTLVLGGLIQTEEDATTEKVPMLGDIPGVGILFRKVRHRKVETELIVLVTPRLTSPIPTQQCPVTLPGAESVSPSDKELFIQGVLERPVAPPAGPAAPVALPAAPSVDSIPHPSIVPTSHRGPVRSAAPAQLGRPVSLTRPSVGGPS